MPTVGCAVAHGEDERAFILIQFTITTKRSRNGSLKGVGWRASTARAVVRYYYVTAYVSRLEDIYRFWPAFSFFFARACVRNEGEREDVCHCLLVVRYSGYLVLLSSNGSELQVVILSYCCC